MAVSGTIAASFDQYRNYEVTITNFNIASNVTPLFRSLGFVIGSWMLTGSLTTPSIALTGSNDGVNFFAITTSPATANGVYTLTNPTSLVPVYYQFSGTGTGTATIVVTMMSTFG